MEIQTSVHSSSGLCQFPWIFALLETRAMESNMCQVSQDCDQPGTDGEESCGSSVKAQATGSLLPLLQYGARSPTSVQVFE